MPRPMAKLAVSEPRMFHCLFRWLLGRTRPKEGEFGYHKKSQTIVVVVLALLTSPVELLVLELVIPWTWLRLVLLALGFYASLVDLPHRLEADALRLRHGVLAEALIPYADISSVKAAERRAPKGGDGLRSSPEEDAVYLAINGKTNVALELRVPRAVSGLFREVGSASTLHLWADEPQKMARELERRLRETLAPGGPPPVTSRREVGHRG